MANVIKIGGGAGGGSILISKTITENGTYNASSDNADGYSEVEVDVAGDKVYFFETAQHGQTPITVILLNTTGKTTHIKITGTSYAPSAPTGYTATTGTISNNEFTATQTSDYHWDYEQEFDITCTSANGVIVYGGSLNSASDVTVTIEYPYSSGGCGGIDYIECFLVSTDTSAVFATTVFYTTYSDGVLTRVKYSRQEGGRIVTFGGFQSYIGDNSNWLWQVTALDDMEIRVDDITNGTQGQKQQVHSGDIILSGVPITGLYQYEIKRYS